MYPAFPTCPIRSLSFISLLIRRRTLWWACGARKSSHWPFAPVLVLVPLPPQIDHKQEHEQDYEREADRALPKPGGRVSIAG